jgi:hypothetical protein
MNGHMWCRRTVPAVMMLALLVLMATVRAASHDARAHPGRYVLTPLVFLGDPTPGGDTFLNDFETGRINHRGDVIFAADVTAAEEEGVFLLSKGRILPLARAGEPAPGGGVFGPGVFTPASLNDDGDAGFAMLLSPFGFPIGVNAGVYRFSHVTRKVTSVVTPGVTSAPGGGVFAGAHFGVSLNNRRHLVFPGIVTTEHGIHLPDEDYIGLGVGLYEANRRGQISAVVSPGDPAPGGGVFDLAAQPRINDEDDVAFIGHVAGEECRAAGFPPQAIFVQCLQSIYVKDAVTGEIRSIAHAGEPAPGGGVFRQAHTPVMNNRGDLVFLGDLTPPPFSRQVTGVYLHSQGRTIAVARPGDVMPGGGRFVSASNLIGWQVHINNPGEVVFDAALDTDVNGNGVPDTGLFVWSHGSLRIVARTGTVIPDVGTVDRLAMKVVVAAGPAVLYPNSGAANNDRGQIVFGATLSDGRGVLLLATPKSPESDFDFR